jgi:FkbM family methyltransferase
MFGFYFKKLYPDLEVTFIEPFNVNVANLQVGCFLNSLKASVIEAAIVGDEPVGDFVVDLNNSGGSGFYPCGDGYETKVNTLKLDDVLNRHYDFVKCDIEGAEFDAFANFTRWDNIGSLFLELHTYPARESKEDQDKLAQEFGAFVVSKMEGKPVWIPGVTCCFE